MTSAPSSSSDYRRRVPHGDIDHDDYNWSLSNVSKLLSLREMTPQTTRAPKSLWGKEFYFCPYSYGLKRDQPKDARQEIRMWVEAESLLHLSGMYCQIEPQPKATLAIDFSPDGKMLASTHSDFSVRIFDCQTGRCLKVLTGHKSVSWTVKFHPIDPKVLASGSLDSVVHLWHANTTTPVRSYIFDDPIDSITFHPQGEILAVASGNKINIWKYNDIEQNPRSILRTSHVLLAVQFHPCGAQLLLTAEKSIRSNKKSATLPGFSRYPPPTLHFSDENSAYRSNSYNGSPIMSLPFLVWPSITRSDASSVSERVDPSTSSSVSAQIGESSASRRLLTYTTPPGEFELRLSSFQSPGREEPQMNTSTSEMGNDASQPVAEPMEIETEGQTMPVTSSAPSPFEYVESSGDARRYRSPYRSSHRSSESPQSNTGASPSPSPPQQGNSPPLLNAPQSAAAATSQVGSPDSHRSSIEPQPNIRASPSPPQRGNLPPLLNAPQSAAAATSQVGSPDFPDTTVLKIWNYEIESPFTLLGPWSCRLKIPHAVLCSERGAHFSPCGRFLAVCVKCVEPSVSPLDVTGAATRPTKCSRFTVEDITYELKIYSLDEATFGLVLNTRPIKAAAYLISIQFSPTSEHLLLVYGQQHRTLLKSALSNGGKSVLIYTNLEIYRVCDMELIKILANAEEVVNSACFHPSVGGGFAYGTNNGKLRILKSDISHGFRNDEPEVPEGIFEA
ncbi:uncharacterized protein LOC127249141 isoform X3 [Andrographis paniculata]|uniref:uncharacterized protein LOC127249141 isoform X3 n=1 Tax=Andrographis paniculata TaxID=175694 RepID=UPI0021E803D0|nr:uncharacterized protein LOC127249141 isoform X3 [Andrographis paniculata]